MLSHPATADVALIKLNAPVTQQPVPLSPSRMPVRAGDRFTTFCYGVSVRGEGNTAATLRTAATMGIVACPPQVTMFTLCACKCSSRFTLGTT